MYYIVANPNSDRGRTMFYLPVFTAMLDSAGIPYETHITTAPLDGFERVRDFCMNNKDLVGVIAIGGDGIVQEIAAGMAAAYLPECGGSQTRVEKKIPVPLGILPSATGSDFISTLEGSKHLANAKYGKNKNIEEVCRNLFDSVTSRSFRPIDIVCANGRAFLNNGHVGLDAQVAKGAIELERKFNDTSYYAMVYKCIARHKNLRLSIETTNETENGTITNNYEGEFTMAVVGNGQYYGSGMRICPDAKIDDGKLTVCMVKGMNRFKAVVLFPSILRETHMKRKAFTFEECDSVKITLPPDLDFYVTDGNVYPCNGEIIFKILPGALNIFV